MKKSVLAFLLLLAAANIPAQLRSFNQIFPNAAQDVRAQIFSGSGYVNTSQKSSGFVMIGNRSALDSSIINMVLDINPGYFVESISIIPGRAGSVSLLNIYNSLGNIRDLRGRVYNSHSRGQETPLFEEATRLSGQRQTSGAIGDPSPASSLPQTETIFIRLRDVNFGNTYYKAEMALLQSAASRGIRYTMTNFRSMTYLFVPVIREGKFIAQLYFEPIQEGVLIYSVAGADVSQFFASRIHVPSAISKRLEVITEWAADGFR